MIHMYCGDGKGKTTAGLGLCLRAAGAGKKVLIYQFLKNNTSSECLILDQISGVTRIRGPEHIVFLREMTPEGRTALSAHYEKVLSQIKKELLEGKLSAEVIFLDEILYAISRGVVDETRCIDLLRSFPDKEWILSGRYTGERLVELSDYISVIQKEKHPYDRGIKARKGIEF